METPGPSSTPAPSFTPYAKPQRRSLPIRGQIALAFGMFILVIALLLWGLQIALLGPFYQMIRTGDVQETAAEVVALLDSDTLDEQVREISNDRGMVVVVTDEEGAQICGYRPTQRQSLLESLSRSQLVAKFDEVNLAGGTLITTYDSPYVYQNGSRPKVILLLRVVRTPAGLARMVLLESEITPVDAVQDTLRFQLITVTVVMVLLGALMAFFIARRISRPVAAVNESAKELARGNYDIRFEGGGAREVGELAQTLNVAAEELSKVEKLRRELLANVSHDLRTPLTMIRGYSEVLRDLPGEDTPENVQIIIDETQRLTDLVNDLLDLSRLESGVVKLDVAPFDLTDSIRTILARYDKLADYSFPFAYDREVTVNADELKISQVVYNLVNNAITYAGEDKTVSLTQTVLGDRVRISVSDTGEGIPADKLKDIWERYYKVDKEHKRAQVGTGLGLSIVKNILDLHQGAYGVESTLGAGSTFWFELPVESASPGDEG